MRLDHPFIRLPLQFDAARLADEINAMPESAWRPHPHGYPGNSAMPLIASLGNPANDETRGAMRATPHLAAMPYVRQVMAALGVPLGRTRLMRIDGNGEATMHVDSNYYWQTHVRIHVPVITTPDVAFLCRDARVHMRAGECWIFDTWSAHNVLNPDPTRRIHLVIDSVGSEMFWHLVAAGDHPAAFHPEPLENARATPYQPGQEPLLRFENFNQPLVMSPGEVASWFTFARDQLQHLADTMPEAWHALAEIDRRFQRRWSAAYAEFGVNARGHARMHELLQQLDRELDQLPREFCARNHTHSAEMLRQLVSRVAVNTNLGDQYHRATASAPELPAPKPSATAAPIAAVPARTSGTQRFDRPVFIVSAPRSGSSLLFDTLIQAPDAWSIGGESHRLIEQIPSLNPASVQFDSNRVDADKATPMTVAELTHGFFGQLRDRDGKRVKDDAAQLRLVEKTPKNALRVPFLAKAYADAKFIVLHREPRDVLSSMLDAWRSRHFVTYPKLAGWSGEPWSLVLTSGWREWNGLPLHEIVARQWSALISQMLDDLEALDADRFAMADYAELLRDPNRELQRLCLFAGLGWDRNLAALPHSRHTLTPPDPDKWKRNAAELEAMMPLVQPVIDRFRAFLEQHRPRLPDAPPSAASTSAAPETSAPASLPAPSQTHAYAAAPDAAAPAPAARERKPIDPASAKAAATKAFGSVYTGSMPALVEATGGSLMVTTYQSGRAILVRHDKGSLNTHFKAFASPMGVACEPGRMVLATARSVIEFHDQKGVAKSLAPDGSIDACFVPRKVHYTGDIRIHEIGFAGKELWIVNTRFSCLATLDARHNFVPRWQPRFITRLEPADRCHLNGMCIHEGRVQYVTALAETDVPGGWREHKAAGGLLIDVASNEIVARGLSMPHSPRMYDGRMWVLESGKGALSTIDIASGRTTVVCELPGFTRGLAFHGHHAFIGLSQVRESVFGGLPLVERLSERLCGVWAVDLRSGKIAGFLRFEGAVQEIFDVQLLVGLKFPELFEPEDERNTHAFVLPEAALA
jgi:uncharacterized protein (TIGR03032 family)